MNKRKMSTTLSIMYVILIVFMISVVSIWFYKYNKTSMHDNGISNLSQMTDATMFQIDSRLANMEQTTIDVLAQNNFLEYWENYIGSESSIEKIELERILTNAYKNKSDIRRVAIYNKDGVYISTGKNNVIQKDIINRVNEIEKQYSFSNTKGQIFLGPKLDFWDRNAKAKVICEIKPIKNRENEILGYIEVQQNSFYIRDICKISWGSDPLDTMIFFGENDQSFYQDVTWKDEKDKVLHFYKMTQQYIKIRETDDDVIATATSNYYACRTVIVLPTKVLYDSMGKIIEMIIIIASLLIIITILYIFIMTNRIMKPINHFIKRMQSTELENFAQQQTEQNMDWETEVLVTAFEDMTSRLRISIEKQKHMADVQTKTLFSILQSEISPHFLYNTLGSIANLCENEETIAAADACYSLTEIMRYSSNYTTTEVTIEEELENLKAYFSIMKSRYRQRFEYEIEVDEEVKYMIIPKLTLQPIVENAIRHSLIEVEKVIVIVYVIYFDKSIIIEIKDNGCGFSKEGVELVKQRIKEFEDDAGAKEITDNIQFGGMGLSGTLIRLSIFFGEDFSYEILGENDEGGTTIVLHIQLENQ